MLLIPRAFLIVARDKHFGKFPASEVRPCQRQSSLSVSVENRPGTLARVARVLGDAKVNILAFLTTISNTEGAVHVVVDNVDQARNALGREKLSFTEADVLHLELPNKPGALASFAGKLAAQEINISLGYQTSVKGSKKANVVLAVSDLEKAARVR